MPPSLFPSGSGGPALPVSADTMLVLNGRPSMPIHLCLSVLRDAPQDTRVLLVTSSRYCWHDALVELNDHWLHGRGRNNDVAHLLSRMDVFHPPSHKHWEVLFSAIRLATPDDPQLTSPFVLPGLPAMIVLCEPSHYFMDGDRGHGVLSDYVSLLACAKALSQYLCHAGKASRRPPVVVFDSYLDVLELPVLRPEQIRAEDDSNSAELKQPRLERVLHAAERYFQWTCLVDTLPTAPDSKSDDEKEDVDEAEVDATYSVTFRCTRAGSGSASVNWTWVEGRLDSTVANAPALTTVSFLV